MDGKLLILCDEIPGDYDRYSVKDAYYLKETMRDSSGESQMLFVSWDAIIPSDQTFINGCIGYARSYSMTPDFALSKKGVIDSRNGNIKTSIQEESYLSTYESNLERVRRAVEKGEDYQAEAIDLASEYPFLAFDRFLVDLSYYLNLNGVIRVLPTYGNNVSPEIVRHRMMVLTSWVNRNKILRENASKAEVLDGLTYDEFGEVYSRALNELMKIMTLPIFGGTKER